MRTMGFRQFHVIAAKALAAYLLLFFVTPSKATTTASPEPLLPQAPAAASVSARDSETCLLQRGSVIAKGAPIVEHEEEEKEKEDEDGSGSSSSSSSSSSSFSSSAPAAAAASSSSSSSSSSSFSSSSSSHSSSSAASLLAAGRHLLFSGTETISNSWDLPFSRHHNQRISDSRGRGHNNGENLGQTATSTAGAKGLLHQQDSINPPPLRASDASDKGEKQDSPLSLSGLSSLSSSSFSSSTAAAFSSFSLLSAAASSHHFLFKILLLLGLKMLLVFVVLRLLGLLLKKRLEVAMTRTLRRPVTLGAVRLRVVTSEVILEQIQVRNLDDFAHSHLLTIGQTTLHVNLRKSMSTRFALIEAHSLLVSHAVVHLEAQLRPSTFRAAPLTNVALAKRRMAEEAVCGCCLASAKVGGYRPASPNSGRAQTTEQGEEKESNTNSSSNNNNNNDSSSNSNNNNNNNNNSNNTKNDSNSNSNSSSSSSRATTLPIETVIRKSSRRGKAAQSADDDHDVKSPIELRLHSVSVIAASVEEHAVGLGRGRFWALADWHETDWAVLTLDDVIVRIVGNILQSVLEVHNHDDRKTMLDRLSPRRSRQHTDFLRTRLPHFGLSLLGGLGVCLPLGNLVVTRHLGRNPARRL